MNGWSILGALASLLATLALLAGVGILGFVIWFSVTAPSWWN